MSDAEPLGLWKDAGGQPQPPLPLPSELPRASGANDLALEAKRLQTTQGELVAELGKGGIEEALTADRSPIPTAADREGYFGEHHLAYWLSGLGDVLLLERIAARRQRPLAAGQRLLDFGCASGRVLRHFAYRHPGMELLGVDISARSVEWSRRHLPLAVTVSQGTVLPQLPLEDRSIDVVFAGSVFTHIAEFEEAWLLELRRVLAPGGFALVTYHPDRIWPDLRDPSHLLHRLVTSSPHRLDPDGIAPVTAAVFDSPMPSPRTVFVDLAQATNNANVIHADAWVRDRWGRHLELEQVVRRAHGGHQDAAVLGRR